MLHFVVQWQSKGAKKEGREWTRGTKQRRQFWCKRFFCGHLQGLLGEHAKKGPVAAAEFLKAFYRAALAITVDVKAEGTP